MICNNCGRSLPKDSEFCQYCGYKIANENVDIKPIIDNNSKSETRTFKTDTVNGKRKFKFSLFKISCALFIGCFCSCGFSALLYFISWAVFDINEDWVSNIASIFALIFLFLGILAFIGIIISFITKLQKKFRTKSIEKSAKISVLSNNDNQVLNDEKINKLLSKGFLYTEEKDWKNAKLTFNSILDVMLECSEAYIGKLLVDLFLPTKKELFLYNKDFSNNLNFQRALRFANESQEKVLENLELTVKQNAKKQKAKDKKAIKKISISFIALWLILTIGLSGYWGYIKIILPKNKYNDAITSYENKQYSDAMAAFIEIKDYKDSIEKYNEILYNHSDTINVGDTILFGNYTLPNSDENEAVEWIVIDKRNSQLLLISSDILFYAQWHRFENDNLLWKDCDLRAELNSEYLNSLFSKQELNKILESNLENNVTDKLFLLSEDEFDKYNKSDVYGEELGCQSIDDSWWLRTKPDLIKPKNDSNKLTVSQLRENYNRKDSAIVIKGYTDYADFFTMHGVRPAMWVDFSK